MWNASRSAIRDRAATRWSAMDLTAQSRGSGADCGEASRETHAFRPDDIFKGQIAAVD
jgi:hypothetical protein